MASHAINKRGWTISLSVLVIIATLTGCSVQVRPVVQQSPSVEPTEQPSPTLFIALTYDARDGMLIGMQRESQSELVNTVVDLKLLSKP